MIASGKSIEDVARYASGKRREMGKLLKEVTPKKELDKITKRNINEYGDPLGPTVDYLRNDGKSWHDIIKSSVSPGGTDLGIAYKLIGKIESFK